MDVQVRGMDRQCWDEIRVESVRRKTSIGKRITVARLLMAAWVNWTETSEDRRQQIIDEMNIGDRS